MKKRSFIYLGVTAVLAGTVLSCGATELNLNNYTDITTTDAQTIINNFNTAAVDEIETLVLEQNISDGDYEYYGLYNIDFSEDSLYLYIELEQPAYETDMTTLITGSGDSYTIYMGGSIEGQSMSMSTPCDYASAKEFFDIYVTTSVLNGLVFNENYLTQMESYGDVQYSTYSDYIKLHVTAEENLDENTYGYANWYVIYNLDGLLRYYYLEESYTIDGETTSILNYMSAEYNVSLNKKTSL